MKVYSWETINKILPDFDSKEKTVSALTIGGFDGPHKGHESLFESVQRFVDENKDKYHILSGVITFSRSPKASKLLKNYKGDISTLSLRENYFTKKGFDYCVVIDFSDNFSKMKGYNFLNRLRELCSMQFLTVGSDFRCGYNLDTGVAEISEYMKQFDLELEVCNEVLYQNKRISSSLIREAVSNGNLELAKNLLGYSYCIDCTEFSWHIDSSASLLFFTANRVSNQIIPKNGIYDVMIYPNNDEVDYQSAKLYVESNFLRLEISLEYNFTTVNRICFN